MNGSYDEHGKKLTLTEMFVVWDDKKYAYDEVQSKLLQLQDGDKLGQGEENSLLGNCTLCPVHNGTCHAFFEIVITGYNPDLGHKKHRLTICPYGVQDIKKCPLSK